MPMIFNSASLNCVPFSPISTCLKKALQLFATSKITVKFTVKSFKSLL